MILCRREFAKGGASGTRTMVDLFFTSLAVPLRFSQKYQTRLNLKQHKGHFEKCEETLTENSKCSLQWESILLAPLVEAMSHIVGQPLLPHIAISRRTFLLGTRTKDSLWFQNSSDSFWGPHMTNEPLCWLAFGPTVLCKCPGPITQGKVAGYMIISWITLQSKNTFIT